MPRVDPYKNFRFLVEIEGITQAGFSECSGFGSEVEVIEYREGGEPTSVRKLPGRVKYPQYHTQVGGYRFQGTLRLAPCRLAGTNSAQARSYRFA
jgi:hypothetical protein